MSQVASMQARHVVSRVLHRYADWRIGANESEKRCHKFSDSILLTFDDLGTRDEITQILTILAEKQIKAMFFLVGSWASEHSDLVQLIRAAGHIIGNHTQNHPNLLKLNDTTVLDEITNGLPSRWLRAPQGRANQRIRKLAATQEMRLCYWTIDSRDWTGASVEAMRHTILSEIHPGAVILFHINGHHTRALLPSLIDAVRTRGYEFTSQNEQW